MRVAILSYPMLFQRQGGLQIQILETISALNELDIRAELINPNQDRLGDYDLIHVFSAINGNHRIVEAAKDIGKPVVISPLIRPDWNRFTGFRERFLDKVVGKLTGWHIYTTFREIEYCLTVSDAIVALGEIEKASIESGFQIQPGKTTVIPNGIPQRFFDASPDLFVKQYSISPGFVLCVAAINAHKNQLTLAQALRDSGEELVLIGSCLESSKAYLADILSLPNVHYVGPLGYDDPLLASAYAAAGVFCLPSMSEVMPLSVLEALASNTPVVMTQNHCMNIEGLRDVVAEINPRDPLSIRTELESKLCDVSNLQGCRSRVASLTWGNVAMELAAVYRHVLSKSLV